MRAFTDLFEAFKSPNPSLIWEQFAAEQNGIYIIGHYDIPNSVEILYRGHTIIFDRFIYRVAGGNVGDESHTGIRMELKSPNDFRFKVVNQGIINTIGKFLGFQDIKIDNKQFDKRFMIQGNDENRIKNLFSDQDLRNYILKQEEVQLQMMYKEGVFYEPIQEGNAMIHYLSETRPEKVDELSDLLKMYQLLLDNILIS
jgi:hypothetical protein